MGVSSAIEVVLALLSGVLSAIKPLPGLQNVIAAVESSIAALAAIHNDPVTKAQVDSLKLAAF